MPKKIDIPGIGVIEFPDGMSDTAIVAAIENDIIPQREEWKAQRPGFVESFKTGIADATVGAGRAAQQTVQPENLELERKQLEGAGGPRWAWGDAKSAARRGEYGEAAGELWGLTKQGLGSSIGAMLPAALGGVAAARYAPTPYTKIAGTAAAGGLMALEHYGSNIRRQAAEREAARQAGATAPEWRFGKAGTAAVGQGALDLVTLRVAGLQRLFGMGEREATKQAAKELSTEGWMKSLGVGTGRTALAEVPTEVSQQALERWQAGLPLGGKEAMGEYEESAVGALLVSPAFGLTGRRMEVGQARRAETARAEEAAKVEQAAKLKADTTEKILAGGPTGTFEGMEAPTDQVASRVEFITKDVMEEATKRGVKPEQVLLDRQRTTKARIATLSLERDKLVQQGRMQDAMRLNTELDNEEKNLVGYGGFDLKGENKLEKSVRADEKNLAKATEAFKAARTQADMDKAAADIKRLTESVRLKIENLELGGTNKPNKNQAAFDFAAPYGAVVQTARPQSKAAPLPTDVDPQGPTPQKPYYGAGFPEQPDLFGMHYPEQTPSAVIETAKPDTSIITKDWLVRGFGPSATRSPLLRSLIGLNLNNEAHATRAREILAKAAEGGTSIKGVGDVVETLPVMQTQSEIDVEGIVAQQKSEEAAAVAEQQQADEARAAAQDEMMFEGQRQEEFRSKPAGTQSEFGFGAMPAEPTPTAQPTIDELLSDLRAARADGDVDAVNDVEGLARELYPAQWATAKYNAISRRQGKLDLTRPTDEKSEAGQPVRTDTVAGADIGAERPTGEPSVGVVDAPPAVGPTEGATPPAPAGLGATERHAGWRTEGQEVPTAALTVAPKVELDPVATLNRLNEISKVEGDSDVGTSARKLRQGNDIDAADVFIKAYEAKPAPAPKVKQPIKPKAPNPYQRFQDALVAAAVDEYVAPDTIVSIVQDAVAAGMKLTSSNLVTYLDIDKGYVAGILDDVRAADTKLLATEPGVIEDEFAGSTDLELADELISEQAGRAPDSARIKKLRDAITARAIVAGRATETLRAQLAAAAISNADITSLATDQAEAPDEGAIKETGKEVFGNATDSKPKLLESLEAGLTDEDVALITNDPQLGKGDYDTGLARLSKYVAEMLGGKKLMHLKRAVRDLVAKIKNGMMSFAVAINFNVGITPAVDIIPVIDYDMVSTSPYAKSVRGMGRMMPTDVRAVANYALDKGNGKPFFVVDKPTATIYLFSADGALQNTAPVILGATEGDAANIGKSIDDMSTEDKITPAGEFTLQPVQDPEYGTRLDLVETDSGASVIAIHSVYLGTPSEQRQNRLDSVSTSDNRISYGCVNVPKSFAAQFDSAGFAGGSKLYITPDFGGLNKYFAVAPDVLKAPAMLGVAPQKQESRMLIGKEEGRQARELLLRNDRETQGAQARKEAGQKPRYTSTKELGLDLIREFGVEPIETAVKAGRLKVYSSESDVSMTAEDRATIDGLKASGEGDISGFYQPKGDRIVLIASNIAKVDGIRAAVHEAGVHAGWKAILGEDMYTGAMKQIEDALKSSVASPFNTAAQAAHKAATERAAKPEQIPEERLAYLAERYPDMPLIRRILAAVRNWLRSKGLVKEFTADDLASLARGVAGKWMVQGGKSTEAAPMTRVGTSAFKEWFGDSKVVDENGAPLRVYRGVDKDYGPTMRVAKDGALGAGIYTTPNAEFAASYAAGEAPNVIPAYVSMQSPLVLRIERNNDDPMTVALTMLGMTRSKAEATVEKAYEAQGYVGKQVMTRARAQGYDGIMLYHNGALSEVLAFSPTQVKSAVGNTGAYSPYDANILARKTAAPSSGASEGARILADTGYVPPPMDNMSAGDKIKAVVAGHVPTTKLAGTLYDKLMQLLDVTYSQEQKMAARKSQYSDEAEYVAKVGALAQIGHYESVAGYAMEDGGVGKGTEGYFEALKSKFNGTEIQNTLLRMAKAHNIAYHEARTFVNAGMEAKRVEALYDAYDAAMDKADALESAGKTKLANAAREDAEARIPKHMTRDVAKERSARLFAAYPEIQEVIDIKNGMRKWIVDFIVDSGMWSRDFADGMLANVDWIPFNRRFSDEEHTSMDSARDHIASRLQPSFKNPKFKGSEREVTDLIDNFEQWSMYVLRNSMRNATTKTLSEDAVKFGDARRVGSSSMGKENRMVRYFDKGSAVYVEFDNALEAAMFNTNMANPEVSGFIRFFNSVFRNSIIAAPTFSAKQLLMDTQTAMLNSGLPPSVVLSMPKLVAKEMEALMRGNQTEAHKVLRARGFAGPGTDVGVLRAEDLRKATGYHGDVDADKSVLAKARDWGLKQAMHSDNAIRQALFIAAKDAGWSDAKAIKLAADIINFRRKSGNKVLNHLSAYVPFFTAAMAAMRSDLAVLGGKGLTGQARAEVYKRYAQNAAILAALSLAFAMGSEDDEEYQKMSPQQRARQLTIPGMGGWGIPRRPSLTNLLPIAVEMAYNQSTDKTSVDSARLWADVRAVGIGAVSMPEPVSAPVHQILEQLTNYNAFTGDQIVSHSLGQQEAWRQYGTSTSSLARTWGEGMGAIGLGKLAVASPVRADHFVRGMFGAAGTAGLLATNIAASVAGDRPTMSAKDLAASIPGFTMPGAREFNNAERTDLFDVAKKMSKVAATANALKREGNVEEYIAYVEEHREQLMADKQLGRVEAQLAKIRKQIKFIRESNIPNDEKTVEERRLKQIEATYIKNLGVKELRERVL